MSCWSAIDMAWNTGEPPSTSRAWERASSLICVSLGRTVTSVTSEVPFSVVRPGAVPVRRPRAGLDEPTRVWRSDTLGRKGWPSVRALRRPQVVRERILQDALRDDETVDLADEVREVGWQLERRLVVVGDCLNDAVTAGRLVVQDAGTRSLPSHLGIQLLDDFPPASTLWSDLTLYLGMRQDASRREVELFIDERCDDICHARAVDREVVLKVLNRLHHGLRRNAVVRIGTVRRSLE